MAKITLGDEELIASYYIAQDDDFIKTADFWRDRFRTVYGLILGDDYSDAASLFDIYFIMYGGDDAVKTSQLMRFAHSDAVIAFYTNHTDTITPFWFASQAIIQHHTLALTYIVSDEGFVCTAREVTLAISTNNLAALTFIINRQRELSLQPFNINTVVNKRWAICNANKPILDFLVEHGLVL